MSFSETIVKHDLEAGWRDLSLPTSLSIKILVSRVGSCSILVLTMRNHIPSKKMFTQFYLFYETSIFSEKCFSSIKKYEKVYVHETNVSRG